MDDDARENAFHEVLKTLSESEGHRVLQTIKAHLHEIHESGRRTAVLDIGTGTGLWANELADGEEYTDVTGINIDIRPVTSYSRWNNVVFEQVDVKKPLPYTAGWFDVVHIRNINIGITNYLQFIERCARILKKGGLLVVSETDPFFTCALSGHRTSYSLRTWKTALRIALVARNVDPEACHKLSDFVVASGVFERAITLEQINVPISQEHLTYEFAESYFQSLEHLLLEHGYSTYDVENLRSECFGELTETNDRYFQRTNTVIAKKIGC